MAPRTLGRFRQPVVGLSDAVGLLRIFAIPDHLVRQFAGRESCGTSIGCTGGWQWFGVAVVAFQFVVPFLSALIARSKARTRLAGCCGAVDLSCSAICVLCFGRSCRRSIRPSVAVHVSDVAAPLALGGLWMFCCLILATPDAASPNLLPAGGSHDVNDMQKPIEPPRHQRHEPDRIATTVVVSAVAGTLVLVGVSVVALAYGVIARSLVAETPEPIASSECQLPAEPSTGPQLIPDQHLQLEQLRQHEDRVLQEYALDRSQARRRSHSNPPCDGDPRRTEARSGVCRSGEPRCQIRAAATKQATRRCRSRRLWLWPAALLRALS